MGPSSFPPGHVNRKLPVGRVLCFGPNKGKSMKSPSLLIGTVLLAAPNATDATRFNLRQVVIVTPSVASSVGVNYENAWDALQEKGQTIFGDPIVIRFTEEGVAAPAGSATLPLEKLFTNPEKSPFSRSVQV